MRVVGVTPSLTPDARIRGAVRALASGDVIAIPTETFYGLAADCRNAEALRKVNALKQKPADSPILLLLAGPHQLDEVALTPAAEFEGLARRFWPGPLTLVVPARKDLPYEVHGGLGSVAVRVPGLELPRRLAAALGRPITGVSANRHGMPPCRTSLDVASAFPDELEWVLDGGPTPGGAPSTIVDLTGPRPRVIREGQLPRAAIARYVVALD